MKKTDKQYGQKRTRRNRGEYYITPASQPKYDDAGPYWIIDGITLWGDRIRLVRREYEAVRLLRNEYEDADKKYKKDNKKEEMPAVIVSKVLDEVRLAEATRAIALLPD